MKFGEFKQDARAQKRFLIFGGAIVGGIGLLVLPSSFSLHRDTASQARGGAKPNQTRVIAVNKSTPPGGPSGGTVTTTETPPVPPPVAVPPPDPFAPVLGRWQGAMQIPERGVCQLLLTVRENKTEHPFEGYSTLTCVPSMMEALAQASKDAGRQISPAEALDRWSKLSTPTSASFAGQVENGAIEFKTTDTIGVVENKNNCTMLSMTVRQWDDGISVKWHEAETAHCHGGEMVMSARR
jgi:hypothetical protein